MPTLVACDPLLRHLLSGSALRLRRRQRQRLCSMLDPEGTEEPQVASPSPSSFSRASLIVPLAMLIVLAGLLLLAFSASEQKEDNFYSFKVVNIRGKLVSLERYRGSVSLPGEIRRRLCWDSQLRTNPQATSACRTDGRTGRAGGPSRGAVPLARLGSFSCLVLLPAAFLLL